MRIDNEEFRSDEVSLIQENMFFEAEQIIDFELLKQSMENYKTIEVEQNTTPLLPEKTIQTDVIKKINKLKTGLNSLTSTFTTATVALVSVVAGIVPIVNSEENIVEEIVCGDVGIINYFIDYSYYDEKLKSDVKIYFNNELSDGYTVVFKNKNTGEIKYPTTNYITFNDVGHSIVIFETIIYDSENLIVDSYDFTVNPQTNLYLGEGDITNYSVISNEDDTYDLLLYLDESPEHLETIIQDINGNILIYEAIHQNNEVLISNIDMDVFDLEIRSYKYHMIPKSSARLYI